MMAWSSHEFESLSGFRRLLGGRCECCLLDLGGSAVRCSLCHMQVHMACLRVVGRICVALRPASVVLELCPEQSLVDQSFVCGECGRQISFGVEDRKPRLCDYSGLYCCHMCHWKERAVIPARVVHNWDFGGHSVSRGSKQHLERVFDLPIVDIEKVNPSLRIVVNEIGEVVAQRRRLRDNMDRLFMSRGVRDEEDLKEEDRKRKTCVIKVDKLLEGRTHLRDGVEHVFSMRDLLETKSGRLLNRLRRATECVDKCVYSL